MSRTRGWRRPDLSGRVALVTGASHGVGRGIAFVLGECGATVYVTARRLGRLRQTAREVTARGGRGVAVRCDHRDDDQVAALFGRIAQNSARLDILVNNVVSWGDGGPQPWGVPAWDQPQWWWDGNFERTLHAHFVATRLAIPVMLRENWGLIVSTSEQSSHPDVTSHLRAVGTSRLMANLARQLKGTGIATVALCPGWTRTDGVIEAMRRTISAGEDWTWKRFIAETESQEFPGRAVAALAAAPERMRHSGHTLRTNAVAARYGFRDIDGRRPK